MEIDLIKRSIRLDRQRLEDTSSDLLIQKNIGKTAVIGRSRAIKERINKKFMELEHEKPVVKQFVADWYEKHKNNIDFEIWHYLHTFSSQKEDEFKKWMNKLGEKQIQTLVNMHQFGYTVEKEKRYLVNVKNVRTRQGTLNRSKRSGAFIFSNPEENNLYGTKFTRTELEQAGFGWVFDCPGVEVEEVEE